MKLLLEIVFWFFTLLFLANYFVYPAIVIAVSKFLRPGPPRTDTNAAGPRKVSLIIAAYNEEKVIEAKLRNSLELDYPRDRFEIIVVSDGSDDKTHEIAAGFHDRGVVALHDDKRNGKSAALNRGAAVSSGEILVFSDANNDFHRDAIHHLVKHFDDPQTGAVTGAKHVYARDDLQATQGDGLYWRYESGIKLAESDIGSITSGDGEIFAIRKRLFEPIEPHIINDDAALTFSIVKQGYRVLYEPAAKSYENASKDLVDDFHVKVRMSAGGYQTIRENFAYLFPPGNLFAFQFILHKVLRWLCPVFLIFIFLSSALLAGQAFYRIVFLLQVVFYAVSIVGWLNRSKPDLSSFLYIPMYFSVMNLALLFGLFRHLGGRQNVQWRKAAR
jgi:cellulose synthase/poly-beta-1,6-N-acetylglucosamine synthase-like glycosyltransferase